MSMFHYESDDIANICQGIHSSDNLYVAECKQTIIHGVQGSYPQLCDYEKEWLMYGREHYVGGEPSNLEYKTVEVNPTAMVENAIPYNYKSAILKGQTLVNLASHCELNLSATSKIETGFKLNAMAEDFDHRIGFLKAAKPNTYYTYIFTSDTAFEYNTGWDATNGGSWNRPAHQAVVGLNVLRVKTEVNTTKNALLFRTTGNRVGNKDVYLTNFMLLEGDYTNLDIPYFEGMQSVRMPVLTTTNGEPEFIEVDGEQVPNEAFKSNILTVNEDVTLRSNGDVYDELNLLTGRLTQRIDENNEVLAQEVVKTVALSHKIKPYEGFNHYQVSSQALPPIVELSVPVVSTGAQTLNDILTAE